MNEFVNNIIIIYSKTGGTSTAVKRSDAAKMHTAGSSDARSCPPCCCWKVLVCPSTSNRPGAEPGSFCGAPSCACGYQSKACFGTRGLRTFGYHQLG